MFSDISNFIMKLASCNRNQWNLFLRLPHERWQTLNELPENKQRIMNERTNFKNDLHISLSTDRIWRTMNNTIFGTVLALRDGWQADRRNHSDDCLWPNIFKSYLTDVGLQNSWTCGHRRSVLIATREFTTTPSPPCASRGAAHERTSSSSWMSYGVVLLRTPPSHCM